MSDLNLTQDRALVFRLVHRANLPLILAEGLVCRSQAAGCVYHAIGNAAVIADRANRSVPIAPFGTLADYVPFYFTPLSKMAYNIHTGLGVRAVASTDLLILVSSVPHLIAGGHLFVISDRHARLATAEFFSDPQSLARLPWVDWQRRDFRADPDRPDKGERYQAELLVYRQLPLTGLIGIAAVSTEIAEAITSNVQAIAPGLPVRVAPTMYFP